jgi:hypothetical protein
MPSKKRLISVALLSILTMTKLAGAVPADDGERILYSFAGGTSDGSEPLAGLVLDAAGNFYGTTFHGGNDNTGTVFAARRKWGLDRDGTPPFCPT